MPILEMWGIRQRTSLICSSAAAVSIGAAYLFHKTSSCKENPKIAIDDQPDLPDSVKRYCNYPMVEDETGLSADYLKENGLKLRGLYLSTRHGDRAPIFQFADHLTLPYCGLRSREDSELYNRYIRSLTENDSMHILSHEKLKTFRKFPIDEICRPGDLTQLGIIQMLKLGQMLKKIYGHIFPFETAEISIATTNYKRTYQSCLAVLHELLGEKQSGVIPILGIDTYLYSYFCTEPWCKCKMLSMHTKKYVREHKEYFEKNGKNDDVTVINKVNEIFQSDPIADAIICHDNLMVYACHQAPLPQLPNEKCSSSELLTSLKTSMNGRFLETSKSDVAYKKSLLEALPIIVGWQKMLERLKLDGGTKSVFQYFSTHDINLVAILIVLDVFDGELPPYASNLRVEIVEKSTAATNDKLISASIDKSMDASNYKSTAASSDKSMAASGDKSMASDQKKLYLRFLYNGVDLTGRTRFCKGENLVKFGHYNFCDAQGLTKFVRRYLNEKLEHTKEFRSICTEDV